MNFSPPGAHLEHPGINPWRSLARVGLPPSRLGYVHSKVLTGSGEQDTGVPMMGPCCADHRRAPGDGRGQCQSTLEETWAQRVSLFFSVGR